MDNRLFFAGKAGLPAGRAGMTIMEYAVLLAALVIAISLSYTRVRRAVESKWRQSADSLGMGLQYQTAEGGATETIIIKH